MGWQGEPLILIQTLSRRRKRGRWPQERWVEVLRHVRQELPDAWLLLIGSPREAPQLETLRQACPDPHLRNVSSELPLRRLAALATRAHSCISLDTGPAHIVAACQCPVVVLIGQADPRRNHPIGPPERVQIITGFAKEEWPPSRAQWEATHDIRKIEVAAVVEGWQKLNGRGDTTSDDREGSHRGEVLTY